MRSERAESNDEGRALGPTEAERERTLPHLLTLPEVAVFLSVSPKTVRRLVSRGLPCVRLGRVVRFRQADLLRFVEARKE